MKLYRFPSQSLDTTAANVHEVISDGAFFLAEDGVLRLHGEENAPNAIALSSALLRVAADRGGMPLLSPDKLEELTELWESLPQNPNQWYFRCPALFLAETALLDSLYPNEVYYELVEKDTLAVVAPSLNLQKAVVLYHADHDTPSISSLTLYQGGKQTEPIGLPLLDIHGRASYYTAAGVFHALCHTVIHPLDGTEETPWLEDTVQPPFQPQFSHRISPSVEKQPTAIPSEQNPTGEIPVEEQTEQQLDFLLPTPTAKKDSSTQEPTNPTVDDSACWWLT